MDIYSSTVQFEFRGKSGKQHTIDIRDRRLAKIVKEDKLGLDVIYIQAKRWEGTVGRPEIQRFVGALHGLRARKGVFITTSDFSAEAVDYISRIENKIVLISGIQMAQLELIYKRNLKRQQ